MKTDALLQTYFLENDLSDSAKRTYTRVVKRFEKHTDRELSEILEIAEKEEKELKWQKSTLYYFLTSFRKHLYDTLQPSTAQLYFTIIKTVLRYFDVNILPLKSFNTKRYPKVELTPEDIITQEELKVCANVKGPLLKAISLFMSSGGFSLVDALNLTIQDYLQAAQGYYNLPYTNSSHIIPILHELNKRNDVVPVFNKLRRQKTGVQYTTFISPEAVNAVNNYLIYREKKEIESIARYNKKHPDDPKTYPGLQLHDPLFDGSIGSVERMFREANDAVGLGKAGNYVKFAPHMMRRYHTTQLYAAGLTEYEINLLQGRKSYEVIHQSYLRVKTETLKEKYIEALPYLVLDDVYRVKSELDITLEKNTELQNENELLKVANEKYKKAVEDIDNRIERKIREAMELGLSDEEVEDLFS